MIVIADSGSTKTQWVVLNKGKIISDITTQGFNPYYYKPDELEKALFEELHDKIDAEIIEEVFFYGAGCSNNKNCSLVKNALQPFFTKAAIHTEHDLTAAAAALLQNEKGIACILGTGCNSCMWDGEKVTANLPSLGWILADEGSGTYLGKLLLQRMLSNDLEQELTEKFYKEYNLNFESVLHRIYGEPFPNQFFASLSKFAGENLNYPKCRQTVKDSFSDFIEKQVSKYPDYQNQTVSFTGSVAFVFQDILKEVLSEHNITLGIIMQKPMEGLIRYHTR